MTTAGVQGQNGRRRDGAHGRKIRVVIVEPQAIARETLAAYLRSQDDVEVVGTAASAAEALAVASRTAPDVVVSEMSLPGEAPFAVVRQITGLKRPPRVVVLTTPRSMSDIRSAFEAGARACASKAAGGAALMSAIHALQNGDLFLCPVSTGLLLRSREHAPPALRMLTEREHDVLRLIYDGKTDRKTAEHLKLSIRTVHTHRMNIMGKLGVRNATALVRRAIELRLVE